jgi:RNA polymerase sigma-70 factor, ECF subfamily
LKHFTSNQLNNLSDEDLMLSYQDGTAAAFDVLYARHKGGLYRYVLRQLNNREDIANEMFQEIWMKLINARESYQVSAKFTTWFYRLAHNRLVDLWRSEKQVKLQVTYDDEGDVHQVYTANREPHDEMQQQHLRQQLKQAIASLPEEQRSAILLKEDAALSLAEIAQVTGVNRETVKSRLRYGIKRLRSILHPLRPVS